MDRGWNAEIVVIPFLFLTFLFVAITAGFYFARGLHRVMQTLSFRRDFLILVFATILLALLIPHILSIRFN